jgi:hypothetical protein
VSHCKFRVNATPIDCPSSTNIHNHSVIISHTTQQEIMFRGGIFAILGVLVLGFALAAINTDIGRWGG